VTGRNVVTAASGSNMQGMLRAGAALAAAIAFVAAPATAQAAEQ